MLIKQDLKNGRFVYNENEKAYGYLDNVGNAREKGDRGKSTTPEDELSYSYINIITNKKTEGICECSQYTENCLSVASNIDVEIYLSEVELNSIKKLVKAKKRLKKVNDAKNRLEILSQNLVNKIF